MGRTSTHKIHFGQVEKLKTILRNGEDAYIFRYQLAMNRDFVGTAAENSWLIDEKLSVETVSNTSDGTSSLSLVHCSDLPFGLIFCNMSIIGRLIYLKSHV